MHVLSIYTILVLVLILVMLPNTTKQDGRYLKGNYTRFFKLCVVHAPSKLNARL